MPSFSSGSPLVVAATDLSEQNVHEHWPLTKPSDVLSDTCVFLHFRFMKPIVRSPAALDLETQWHAWRSDRAFVFCRYMHPFESHLQHSSTAANAVKKQKRGVMHSVIRFCTPTTLDSQQPLYIVTQSYRRAYCVDFFAKSDLFLPAMRVLAFLTL